MDTLRYALLVILGATLLGARQAEPATKIAAVKAAAPVSMPSLGDSTKRKAWDYCQLTANYEGVWLEVRVNDMPVIMNEGDNKDEVHFIDNLLIGSNTITVVVKPPQGKAYVPGKTAIHLYVTAYPGQVDGYSKGKVLYTYDWKMKDTQLPLPSVRGQFQTIPPLEPLSWQNATKLSLATLDKAGVNAQIKRLYEAFATKNAAAVVALLASETHDRYVSSGRPPGESAGNERKIYEELFRKHNSKFSPIHYEALEYAMYGGGRVVRAHGPRGQAFISMPDKDGPTTIVDIYLSLINGHWVIVANA